MARLPALALWTAAAIRLCGGAGAPEGERCDALRQEADEAPLIQVSRAWRSLREGSDDDFCSGAQNPAFGVVKDEGCKTQSMPGCRADGVNDECRYCGGAPELGFPACPCPPMPEACQAGNPNPDLCVYVEPACTQPGAPLYCGAGGVQQCRYCGSGDLPKCPEATVTTTAATGTATTTTTTTATTTTKPCGLACSLYGDEPSYTAYTESCTQPDPSNNTVWFKAAPVGGCESLATQGYFSWYHDSTCEGTPFASASIYTDGDPRNFCYDRMGNPLGGSGIGYPGTYPGCRGSWTKGSLR